MSNHGLMTELPWRDGNDSPRASPPTAFWLEFSRTKTAPKVIIPPVAGHRAACALAPFGYLTSPDFMKFQELRADTNSWVKRS
jgi:hypothetical protein